MTTSIYAWLNLHLWARTIWSARIFSLPRASHNSTYSYHPRIVGLSHHYRTRIIAFANTHQSHMKGCDLRRLFEPLRWSEQFLSQLRFKGDLRRILEPCDKVNMPATKQWPKDMDRYRIHGVSSKLQRVLKRWGQVRLVGRRFLDSPISGIILSKVNRILPTQARVRSYQSYSSEFRGAIRGEDGGRLRTIGRKYESWIE